MLAPAVRTRRFRAEMGMSSTRLSLGLIRPAAGVSALEDMRGSPSRLLARGSALAVHPYQRGGGPGQSDTKC